MLEAAILLACQWEVLDQTGTFQAKSNMCDLGNTVYRERTAALESTVILSQHLDTVSSAR